MNHNPQALTWLLVPLALVAATSSPLSSAATAPSTSLPESEANHLVVIPRISSHPQPTADLTAPPWNQAARITGFFEIYSERFGKQPTWVYLFYDPDRLWIAFRCEGRTGKELVTRVTERDGSVWRDDSVEVFLDPGSSQYRSFQFIFNSAGVVFDAADGAKSWNPDLAVRTATDETGWTLVAGIPFAAVNMKMQAPGQIWGVNLCRMSSLPEKSCWAPVTGAFRLPQYFGRVMFGDENNPAVRFQRVEPIGIGPNTMTLDQVDGMQYQVVGTTETREVIYTYQDRLTADGKVSFTLPNDRVRHVALSLLDKGGQQLARCWYPITSPELSRKVAAIQNQLAEVSGSLNDFPPAAKLATQTIVTEIRPRLDEVMRHLQDPKLHSADNWEQLHTTCCELELKLDGPACLSKMLVHVPDAPFALGLESPMQKVMIQDFPFDGHFGDHYELVLAKNEHEAFQVAVIPFPHDLEQVTVTASPLLSRDGRRPFTGGKVEVSLIGHVDVADNPRYDADYHGWWPDVLLDFQTTCDVRVGQHVSFWIDVATSGETPAGRYEGTITVSAAGCKPVRLRLDVHVWDFELPNGTHLRNAFTYDHNRVPRFYRNNWSKALARKYHDFLLDHRLNIDHLYRRNSPDIELMEYGVSKGMTAFNIGAPFRHIDEDMPSTELKDYIAELRKKGLFDSAYVYGYDEAHEEKFPEIRQVFGTIHRLWPDLKTMTTAYDPSFGQRTGLRDAVDIWVPVTDWYDQQKGRKLRTEGKAMWWYICIVPVHPYANWFIEYPAIEARLLTGAMSFKYEADGFLYYLVNLWRNNRKTVDKGPFTNWNPASFIQRRDPNDKERITAVGNGDGSLMYPGPDGPLSSIRLENIRDGFEDHEYLYLLKELVTQVRKMPTHADRQQYLEAAELLLAVPDSVVTSVTDYTRNPEALASYRVRLAGAILAGQKLLEPKSKP